MKKLFRSLGFAAGILLATYSVGSCSAGKPTVVTAHKAIIVDGVKFTYTVLAPSSGTPSNIIILLHGGNSTGQNIINQSEIKNYVLSANIMVVAPDTNNLQWQDGRSQTANLEPTPTTDDDYILALERAVGGAPSNTFVAGASSGGMMTQRMACDHPEAFGGFMSVVANMPVDYQSQCNPAVGKPMILIMSQNDPDMPFNGGTIKSSPTAGLGGQVISAPATAALWSTVHKCVGGTPTPTHLPTVVKDGTSVELYNYGACGLNWYVETGAGHTWPGGSSAGQRPGSGKVSGNLNATQVMLRFFGIIK